MTNQTDRERMSDRELLVDSHQKVEHCLEKIDKLDERISKNEIVTEPIRQIALSSWNKLVYALGWGILIAIGLLIYYLLLFSGRIPK